MIHFVVKNDKDFEVANNFNQFAGTAMEVIFFKIALKNGQKFDIQNEIRTRRKNIIITGINVFDYPQLISKEPTQATPFPNKCIIIIVFL